MSKTICFFVTVNGIRIADNSTKQQAINKAVEYHSEHQEMGSIQIGVGRTIRKSDGKRYYSLVPYPYYLD